MSSQPGTGSILTSIETAFASGDARIVGRLLARLITAEPDRWMTLLYLNGILPEPGDKKFEQMLGPLLESLKHAIADPVFSPQNLIQLMLPLLGLHASFSSIRKQLDQLSVWEEPLIRLIVRVAAFVEDQAHLAEDQIERITRDEGYFDPRSAFSASLPSALGGPDVSMVAGYEGNCESLQLILAYCIYKSGLDFLGEVGVCESPYDDADFAQLLLLASVWRKHQELWGNVKYLGWTAFGLPDSEDASIYVPPDYDEFIRIEVGYVRMQQLLSEVVVNPAAKQSRSRRTDTLELVGMIAASLTVPNVGDVWDGVLDRELFRRALQRTWNSQFGELTLELFHYGRLLPSIRLGPQHAAVDWGTYWIVMDALRLLSTVFYSAIRQHVQGYTATTSLRRILLVDRSKLVSLLSATTDVEIEACRTALDVLTFKPQLRHLEVWDTPLIAASDDLVLFVPSLVRNGSPVRAAENFMAQWNEDLFARRGKVLEQEIKESLKEIVGVQVRGPVTLKTADGSDVECDVVVWWNGYLILIEAKCTKAAFDAHDLYRARGVVERAVEQLNLRKSAILASWDVIGASAPDLDLPSEPLPSDRVRLVAVTNLLQFTGWKTQGVVVTDEFCLRRFFGSAEIETYFGEQKIGAVGRIRQRATPTADEFLLYLEDPPQVAAVRDCMKMEPLAIPVVRETDPKIAMLHAGFRARDYDICLPVQDSKSLDSGKVPRNAPCPCGSGRKFKRCCGKGAR